MIYDQDTAAQASALTAAAASESSAKKAMGALEAPSSPRSMIFMMLLTAILADGINLGISTMVEACPGTTARKLDWLASLHIRDEAYNKALTELVHHQPDRRLYLAGRRTPSKGCLQASTTLRSLKRVIEIP